ncbi:MAG: efflux transporter outer membrane subunit [Rickettsiales bacterium]
MRSFAALFFVVVASLTSVSCTLAPHFVRPDFSAAMFWKKPSQKSELTPVRADESEAQTPTPITWRQYYRNPALRQLIARALKHNADVKKAALNVKEARALYRVERAGLLPSLNVDASGMLGERSDAAGLAGNYPSDDSYSVALSAPAYALDFFGGAQSRTKAQYERYLQTAHASKAARLTVITETASAYIRLLADRKLLLLTERTLEAQRNTLALLANSRDVGAAADQDVARAETAVETARVNLHRYRRFVEQDVNALFVLLGERRSDETLPNVEIKDADFITDIRPGLPSALLLARPDVMQAESSLKAANADIGSARAAFFPSITLTGAYGFASGDLKDLFASSAAGAWSFVPRITVPIFQGGRLKGALDAAKIRKEKAVLDYENVIRVAFKDVSNALTARQTLKEQSDAQARLVKAAQRAYNLSKVRYDSGVDSFLSVLDAQRELYAFEQGALSVGAERLQALSAVYAAFGGNAALSSAVKKQALN